MRELVRANFAGLEQCPCIPPIGLHAPAALGVHRSKIGVPDDYLVPEAFQTASDPFTFGGRFQKNARPLPTPELLE